MSEDEGYVEQVLIDQADRIEWLQQDLLFQMDLVKVLQEKCGRYEDSIMAYRRNEVRLTKRIEELEG